MITVNWDVLPNWVNYIARDASNSWYSYAQKPKYVYSSNMWIPDGRTEWEGIPSETVYTVGSVPSSDSLVARPTSSNPKLSNEDLLKRLITNPQQSDINEAIIRIFTEICIHDTKPL